MANGTEQRRGRETRLLVLVVVVSIAVLMLLARFRFPEADLKVAAPAPSPLSGLASQAAFEDMAKTMSQLMGRISSRIWIIELKHTPPPSRGAAPLSDAQARGKPAVAKGPEQGTGRLSLAFLVRPGLAFLHLPADFAPVSVLDSGGPVEVVASDPSREVALIRVPGTTDGRLEMSAEPFAGFSYVGLVEPTRGGPTIHPAFVGRLNTLMDGRWPGAVLTVEGGPAIRAGTLAFSIDGRFVGLVVAGEGGAALVPAPVVEAAVTLLAPAGVPSP